MEKVDYLTSSIVTSFKREIEVSSSKVGTIMFLQKERSMTSVLQNNF